MSTPNAPRPALTPRQRFLRERQQRQNLTFVVVGGALLVVAVIAALVFTGIVPVPFGNDFSVKIKYAETGDIPCPTANSKPVTPSTVSVTVVNTTQHQGLASKATDMLTTAGFQTQEPETADVEYTGKVRITAGASAVDVKVELGTFYDDTMSAEDVQRVLKSTDPVEQPAKCRPMSGS